MDWEEEKQLEPKSDIEFKEVKDNYVIFSLGSGYYKFSVHYS